MNAAQGLFLQMVGGVSVAVLLVSLLFLRRTSRKHIFRQKQARRVRDRLAVIPTFGQQMAYLRKINPFTFEELILESLECKGYAVIRNKRYTGDGGIDGRVTINGQLWYIQAKRYSDHIALHHVREFIRICERDQVKGLFVHTGKTRPGTRQLIHDDERITLISGQKLTQLVALDRSSKSRK